MKPPLRIAVLECDTPLEKTKAKYGSYGGCFEALLRAGAKQLGSLDSPDDLKFTYWDVVNDNRYPDLTDVDGVLLTGSRHNSFDDVPWINTLVDFTAKVLAQNRVRVIGVCFGHQIIGRAMKVEVGRNDQGWEAAVNEVQLSAKGKEVFQSETLSLHQMHRDIVFYYPQGVQELGSSPVCNVQGMYVPRRLITVQGHPEFNEEIMTEILNARHAIGVFDDNTFEEAMKRAVEPHDGLVVSKAFLRFLLD